MSEKITRERAIELLIYNSSTGELFRKDLCRVVGTPHEGRRVYLTLDYKQYTAHRIIWLMVYGEWPEEIDHINGNGLDNRLCNLRSATRSQNASNRKKLKKAGIKGVYQAGPTSWRARITVGQKTTNLGTFRTEQEAYAAYCNAAPSHHGEFARIGP